MMDGPLWAQILMVCLISFGIGFATAALIALFIIRKVFMKSDAGGSGRASPWASGR